MAKNEIKEKARNYVKKCMAMDCYYPGRGDTVSELCDIVMSLINQSNECDFDRYGATETKCDPWEPPSDCNVCPPTPTKFIVIAINKIECITDFKHGRITSQRSELINCWEIIGESYVFAKAEKIAKAYIGQKLGLQCIIQEHVVYG